MTREVMISIRGMHSPADDDGGQLEDIAPGEYFFKNGKHYILYRQVMEGTTEETKNTVKIAEDYMEIIRKGPICTHMVFEKGKRNVGNYNTPYGSIQIGIDTGNVDVDVADDRITVDADYTLDMDGSKAADCRIHMKVTPMVPLKLDSV